jgi:hypothetical protein
MLGAANCPAYRGQAYVVFENLDLTNWGNRLPSFSFEIAVDPAATLTVDDILSDLASQCGMTAGVDYDFSDASDVMTGFTSTQRAPAYQIAEQILDVFSTDVAEIDGKLMAVRRGGVATDIVPQADMGAHDWSDNGQDPPARVESVRTSDLSLPFKVELGYLSYERMYQQSTQAGIKHSRQQVEDLKTYNTSITMRDADARDAADRMLDTEWLERVKHTFFVGPKWFKFAPTSVLTAVINGSNRRLRVVQADLSPLGQLSLQCLDDGAVGAIGALGGYRSQLSLAGYSPPAIASQDSSFVPTVFDVYSGIQFRAEDGNRPGFYVAATGGAGWQGATIYYSTDGGTTYVQGGSVGTKADFGLTTNTLPDWTSHPTVDTTNTLSVQLNDVGALVTVSPTDIANGSNAALVGPEVLSYQNVAATSGYELYDLTTLTRGQLSSPMTGHATGERFWHLNQSIVRVSVDAAFIGTVVKVKVVSANQAIGDVASQDVTIAANVTPYTTKAYVDAAIAGVSGAGTPSATVTDVSATDAVGTSTDYSRGDHAHKGVHSLASLFGDLTLSGSGGIGFGGSSGNNINIDGSAVVGTGGSSAFTALGRLDTGTATITLGDRVIYIFNSGITSNQSIALPALGTGSDTIQHATVYNDSPTHLVTIAMGGSDTVEGATSIVLTPGRWLDLVAVSSTGSDGKWRVVGSNCVSGELFLGTPVISTHGEILLFTAPSTISTPTFTLPTLGLGVGELNKTYMVVIVNRTSGAMTVFPSGSENIDGSSSDSVAASTGKAIYIGHAGHGTNGIWSRIL